MPAFFMSGSRAGRHPANLRAAVNPSPLPFGTRIWFAWACFFRALFDGQFAARVWAVREAPALPPAASAPAEVAPSPTAHDHPRTAPVSSDPTPALQLLALLQREGRFVDFLQQDIASFPDAEIGIAARVVHEGCRKALRSHAELVPVRTEAEGARLTVPAGFRADEIKLVGDVKGHAPYSGVLRHRGWRAKTLHLPQIVGEHDSYVLAPAEVELG
ncbi:MAG TPA: DUF2760 domain-containing protein [Polyangiaceae bacterium]|jgi:hypothetical protein|nr:DUF2760 domain-containing protein [Polyangiaceae bacterium]